MHHAIIAGGVVGVGFFFWYWLAPKHQERISIGELRQQLLHGDSPQERARAASGLGERRDTPSVPLLLSAMEDETPMVRAQAAVAVTKILGADFFYEPLDPPEKRAATIGKYRALWEAWKDKTGYDEELILPNPSRPDGAQEIAGDSK